jgi:N-acetylmuramoyl-L-alanine amidase
MDFKQKYPIEKAYLTPKTKRRSGLMMNPTVKFVVVHDTGNPGSTAAGNVKYYERSNNELSASAHIFVDDKQILECIPALTAPPEKAWHVLYSVPTDNQLFGYNANDAAVGVEYCYGGNIIADEAYRRYLWVIASICNTFGLNPASSIVGHFFLDPKRKTDPVTGLANSRRTYEQLLKDIVTEFDDCLSKPKPPDTSFVEQAGVTRATVKLNLREGAPNATAKVAQTVPPGTLLTYTGWVENGQPINGNSKWYRDPNENFFWSGGVRPV